MKMMDVIEKLSRDIGARPASTEEEQSASLYIAEQFHEIGIPAEIEDFEGGVNPRLAKIICLAVAGVITLLSLFISFLGLLSVLITALAAVVVVLESMGNPILSSRIGKGASQNVVARYMPPTSMDMNGGGSLRTRKVVLVAHYDSGKVNKEMNPPLLSLLPLFGKIELVAFVALPIILLFRNVFFLNFGGPVGGFFTILAVADLIVLLLFLLITLLNHMGSYNEAANANASGVAVMMEVAQRAVQSNEYASYAYPDQGAAEAGFDAVVHGEQEAMMSGYVPAGAQLHYDVPANGDGFEADEGDSLNAAKEAIAALTGSSVDSPKIGSLSENMIRIKGQPDTEPAWDTYHELKNEFSDADEASLQQRFGFYQEADAPQAADEEEFAPSAETQPAPSAPSPMYSFSMAQEQPQEPSLPDWAVRAQEQAKRPTKKEKPAKRSHYASALDTAIEESSGFFKQAQAAIDVQYAQRARQKEGVIREAAPQSAPAPMPAEQPATPAAAPRKRSQAGVQPIEPIGVNELVENGKAAKHIEPSAVKYSFREGGESEPYEEDVLVESNEVQAPAVALQPPSAFAPVESEAPAPVEPAAPAVTLDPLPPVRIAPAAKHRSSLSGLPGFGSEAPSGDAPGLAPGLPSLDSLPSPSASGNIAAINTVGSFAVGTATGAFAPIDEEALVADENGDFYVEDADDSHLDGQYTAEGAFAGPGYMEMPKSKLGGFFGRFRKKNKDKSEGSAHEWLNVDEDFDAREVGARRGSWESFRDDDDAYDDRWNGGGLSLKSLIGRKKASVDDGADFDQGGFDGGFGAGDAGFVDPYGAGDAGFGYGQEAYSYAAGYPAEDAHLGMEMQSIHEFYGEPLNIEVWFVALGAEVESSCGMRALIKEHGDDLRGALIVELDSMGAGDLSLIGKEGHFKPTVFSSRMKRYVTKASTATGISVKSADLPWMRGSAACAVHQGYQAMHLAGMDGNKQAFYSQKDDTIENIDEEKLRTNAQYVMELLRSI